MLVLNRLWSLGSYVIQYLNHQAAWDSFLMLGEKLAISYNYNRHTIQIMIVEIT